MKFKQLACPTCGENAKGTIDTLTAVALLSDPDENTGNVEYDGQTDVDWDDQKTITDDNGHWLLICTNGHCWNSAVELV